jgi:hypothetical protein
MDRPPSGLRAGGRRYPLAKAFLILGVSFLNLVGSFIAFATIGGLGAWSPWQFIGLFGLIEAGMGLAFIVGPNIWRLPVAQANTPADTQVRLALDTLLVPQWGAAAKVGAGVVMVLAAGWVEGWNLGSLTLVPMAVLLAVAVLALSLVVAHWGVARPDLDVVSLVIRRPRHADRELRGISLGGILIQLLTEIGVFPLVKLTQPTMLYQPALAPAPSSLGVVLLFTVALTLLALLLWRGRLAIHAPRAQQVELEQELTA